MLLAIVALYTLFAALFYAYLAATSATEEELVQAALTPAALRVRRAAPALRPHGPTR